MPTETIPDILKGLKPPKKEEEIPDILEGLVPPKKKKEEIPDILEGLTPPTQPQIPTEFTPTEPSTTAMRTVAPSAPPREGGFVQKAFVEPIYRFSAHGGKAFSRLFGAMEQYSKDLSEKTGLPEGKVFTKMKEIMDFSVSEAEKLAIPLNSPEFIDRLNNALYGGAAQLAVDLPLIAQTGIVPFMSFMGGAESLEQGEELWKGLVKGAVEGTALRVGLEGARFLPRGLGEAFGGAIFGGLTLREELQNPSGEVDWANVVGQFLIGGFLTLPGRKPAYKGYIGNIMEAYGKGKPQFKNWARSEGIAEETSERLYEEVKKAQEEPAIEIKRVPGKELFEPPTAKPEPAPVETIIPKGKVKSPSKFFDIAKKASESSNKFAIMKNEVSGKEFFVDNFGVANMLFKDPSTGKTSSTSAFPKDVNFLNNAIRKGKATVRLQETLQAAEPPKPTVKPKEIAKDIPTPREAELDQVRTEIRSVESRLNALLVTEQITGKTPVELSSTRKHLSNLQQKAERVQFKEAGGIRFRGLGDFMKRAKQEGLSEGELAERIVERFMIDKRTGVANEEAFTLKAEEMIRTKEPFNILQVDLDDFKITINEPFGKTFGTKVLKEYAQFIDANLPPGARVYRLGGGADEFLVMIRGTESDAVNLGWRLIDRVKQHPFTEKKLKLGTSVGVARYPDDVLAVEEFHGITGVALEKAKQLGKGRVVTKREVDEGILDANLPPEPPRPPSKPAGQEPDRVGRFNLKSLGLEGEEVEFYRKTYEENKTKIDASRGQEKITFKEMERVADESGLSMKEIMRGINSGRYNYSDVITIGKTFKYLGQKANRLGKEAEATQDPAKKAEAIMAQKTFISSFKEFTKAGTGLGRGLVARKVSLKDPEIAIRNKMMNEILKDNPELTDEQIYRISLFDPEDVTGINVFLQKSSKATNLQKVKEAWVSGILSNPVTQIRNLVGNSLMTMIRPGERALTGGWDMLMSGLTGKPRERFMGEAAASFFGIFHGIPRGAQRAMEAFQTEIPSYGISKLEQVGRTRAISGKKGKIIRIPLRGLLAMDELFKAILDSEGWTVQAYRNSLQKGYRGKKRVENITEILKDKPEAMQESVRKETLQGVFQEPLGTTGKNIQRLRDNSKFGTFIAPFIMTPINIPKQAFRRTPLYFLSLAGRNIRPSTRMGKGEAADALGRATLGSLFMASIAYGIAQELFEVTGGGPIDPKEYRTLRETTGWQRYSFKWKGQYHSYDTWLEPFSTILGVMSDMREIIPLVGNKEWNKIAPKLVYAFSQNILNKTWMRGPVDFSRALIDPERYGERWFTQFTTSFIPRVVSGVAFSVDPTVRSAKNYVDALRYRIPFIPGVIPKEFTSQALFPKRDIWGIPIKKTGSAVSRFINPMWSSEVKTDPLDLEIARLHLAFGYPSRTITRRKKRRRMTELEYDKYWERGGNYARKRVEDVFQSSIYPSLDDEAKRERIRNARSRGFERARNEIFGR